MASQIESPILARAEAHVREIFQFRSSGRHLYHSLEHTEGVVTAAKDIGRGCGLEGATLEDVLLAAWFHDTGFESDGKEHEEESAKRAGKYLKDQGLDKKRISHIRSLILATKFPPQPQTMAEKVLCDADLHHLGKKDFEKLNHLLRAEWEMTCGKTYNDVTWFSDQIDFLTQHHFHTAYAEEKYGKRKNKNILVLHERLKAAQAQAMEASSKLKEKKDKAKVKETKPDRGIETMFRVTSRNHMELSAMADNKANIMISINAIIISITVSAMVPKLDKNAFLIIPTFILLVTCLMTIIYATLSTRPKVSGGTFTPDDLRHRRVNLLFFGNFFKMKYDDFNDGMQEMMEDKSFLYGSMVKDIYSLGQVLGKKYKLIRAAYNIFMVGLVASVLAFALAFAIWNANEPVTPGIPDLP